MKVNNTVKNIYESLNIYSMLLVTICFVIAYLVSLFSSTIAALLLIAVAIYLFFYFYNRTDYIINSRGVFSGIWLGTIGLACFRLHPLQVNWELKTWFCLWIAYFAFLVGFELQERRGNKVREKSTAITENKINILLSKFKFDFFIIMIALIMVIIGAFILDVLYSGYIPMFSDDMSAYKNFGVPYIHYLTVCCALIPSITLYYFKRYEVAKWKIAILIFLNLIVGVIPILAVSRQLLLLEIIVTVFTWFELNREIKIDFKYIILAIVLVFVAWMFLSKFRNQNEAYLRYVFELENVDSPLSIEQWQTYLYVTFNYDNFNSNIINLQEFSYGARALYPLITLLGIKRIFPITVATNVYSQVMMTFNTYPLLMVGYSDFGVVGVGIYLLIIGYFVAFIESQCNKKKNMFSIITHSIVNYALVFSFFTSFFANTSIWVYVIIIYLFSVFIKEPQKSFCGIK